MMAIPNQRYNMKNFEDGLRGDARQLAVEDIVYRTIYI